MTDIRVEIPARAEFVRILRTVAASVAARLDFTFDRIEELRISVDEACAQLLELGGRHTMLTMRAIPSASELTLVLGTDARARGPWPPPDLQDRLAWQVLSGLADEAAFELTDDGPAVRVTIRGGSR